MLRKVDCKNIPVLLHWIMYWMKERWNFMEKCHGGMTCNVQENWQKES